MKAQSEKRRFSTENKISKKRLFLFSLNMMILFLLLTSCGSTKNAVYFSDQHGETITEQQADLEPIIQSNDLLSIVVSSINPEAAEVFNVSRNNIEQSSTSSGNTTRVSGYLVDQEGYINFPILGKIKAADKTKKDLRDLITGILNEKKLLLEPIVDIRYLNYKVSVLGEVKNPSVINVASEKISLLEALGMAGDITIYGRRDNVMLIREDDNIKRTIKIDLTSNEIFSSPYYYLKSNDIIYVEPNKAKVYSSTGTKEWIPVVLSAISLAIIVAVNLK